LKSLCKINYFLNIFILLFIITCIPTAPVKAQETRNKNSLQKNSTRADIITGLVAHWNFDNDNNSVNDISGYNLAGRSHNISYDSGIIGKSVLFDSINDRINISDTINKLPDRIAGLDSGSISVWFKFRNVGGQMLPIFYYGESSNTAPHNSLIIEIGHGENISNRRLYFTIVNSRFCYDSQSNLEENNWYHFVAVVGENGNTGYLNGEEMANRNYNLGSDKNYKNFFSSVTSNKLCAIGYGRYGLNNNFFTFKGNIDDLRIYNRPLTEQDVKELYQIGSSQLDYKPTYENVAYGPYQRNILDFWKAESLTQTPLVIFIHGGGFHSGDKTQARSGSNLDILKRCLENKVSFAAINYRFKETTRLDTIMLDIARALQFIRSKSVEWNIDKDRIASYGGSAGGGATIWLALNDDLADPNNPDLILRESTRLKVAGHLNSQATYDFKRWPEILNMPANEINAMVLNEPLTLYHIPDTSWYQNPEIIELRKKLDMISMIDYTDPPVYFESLNPNVPPTTSGAIIHHPKHPIYLKEIYTSLGLEHAIVLAETPQSERINMLDFFFKYLLNNNTEVDDRLNIPTGYQLMQNFPNPFNPSTEIRYVLQNASFVTLKVYDILGREVTTLADEFKTPGNYSAFFTLNSSLSSGVYFYRLISGNYSITRKMILTK
jgi:hypothetical protein